MVQDVRPPSRGSISLWPMNQELRPGPAEMAAHTCSGVASRVISSRISNSCMSGLLVRYERMDGDHDAVRAAVRRALVVVLGHQAGDRVGQLLGERRAVGGA